MKFTNLLAAAVVVMALTLVARAQPAPETEAASTSKLTGTSFGAPPVRDLRKQVISDRADYLAQIAKQADSASTVSDTEVLMWSNVVQAAAVEAYQKLVTDNLATGGYTYKVTGTQVAGGQTMTFFTAESNQQGRIIGVWQATPQGLFLNWGRVSGAAAPMPAGQAAVQPAAPAAGEPAQNPDLKVGRAYLDAKRYAEAEAVFRKAATDDGHDLEAFNGLSAALGGQRKFKQRIGVDRLARSVRWRRCEDTDAAVPAVLIRRARRVTLRVADGTSKTGGTSGANEQPKPCILGIDGNRYRCVN